MAPSKSESSYHWNECLWILEKKARSTGKNVPLGMQCGLEWSMRSSTHNGKWTSEWVPMEMNIKVLLFSRPGFLCDPGQVTPPPKPHETGGGATLGSPDLKPGPGTLSPPTLSWRSSECSFKEEGQENNAVKLALAASPRAEQQVSRWSPDCKACDELRRAD